MGTNSRQLCVELQYLKWEMAEILYHEVSVLDRTHKRNVRLSDLYLFVGVVLIKACAFGNEDMASKGVY